ncbi:hypothetical protein VF13_36785 [Nostoc linckia z16]|nr:hypothetical protein VF13_36785 [Nostoc linckia z16]
MIILTSNNFGYFNKAPLCLTKMVLIIGLQISYGQSVQSIHEKYLQNLGSRRCIDSITTIFLSGDGFDSQTGTRYIVNIHKALPNLCSYERINDTDTTYFNYDGHTNCLGSRPERNSIKLLNKILSDNQSYFRNEKLFNDFVYIGDKCTLIKRIVESDEEFYVLEYNDKKFIQTFYINCQTYNISKEVVYNTISTAKKETKYSNFKIINCINIPLTEVSNFNIDGIPTSTSIYNYKTVVINKDMSKHRFSCD